MPKPGAIILQNQSVLKESNKYYTRFFTLQQINNKGQLRYAKKI